MLFGVASGKASDPPWFLGFMTCNTCFGYQGAWKSFCSYFSEMLSKESPISWVRYSSFPIPLGASCFSKHMFDSYYSGMVRRCRLFFWLHHKMRLLSMNLLMLVHLHRNLKAVVIGRHLSSILSVSSFFRSYFYLFKANILLFQFWCLQCPCRKNTKSFMLNCLLLLLILFLLLILKLSCLFGWFKCSR